MNEADFRLSRVDQDTQDYWFEVSGTSKEKLTAEYFEQGMIEVSHVVYSLSDNMWAIQREFMFNMDMITPENNELESFIKGLAEKAVKRNA
jgi:hypothetical protein